MSHRTRGEFLKEEEWLGLDNKVPEFLFGLEEVSWVKDGCQYASPHGAEFIPGEENYSYETLAERYVTSSSTFSFSVCVHVFPSKTATSISPLIKFSSLLSHDSLSQASDK